MRPSYEFALVLLPFLPLPLFADGVEDDAEPFGRVGDLSRVFRREPERFVRPVRARASSGGHASRTFYSLRHRGRGAGGSIDVLACTLS